MSEYTAHVAWSEVSGMELGFLAAHTLPHVKQLGGPESSGGTAYCAYEY